MNTPHHNCRLRLPERNQVEIRFLALDQLLSDDHQARIVWTYVEGLNLTPLYQAIQARQGVAGRDANDPRILMALWLYATLDGVGSARRLDELCQESLPYQWLAGGVSMNYHSLADFRVEHVELLDQLLTAGNFASLDDIQTVRAQHGVKVFAPVKDEAKKRERGVDPFVPRPRDTEGVALWRQRMGTAEAQAIYRERAGAAEWVNALARNRGLYQAGVRGRLKVLAVLWWQALAHNLMRAVALRRAAAC